jgi:hypothetical protein
MDDEQLERFRKLLWRLELARDAIEAEQRRQARRTGQPPPSPNAPAVRAKLDALVEKYRVPFRAAQSADRLIETKARAPRRSPAPRRPRRTTRRRATATRAGPDEPSEPEPRACKVCGDSLDGHYSNAKTCKGACRQKLYRQPKKAGELLEPTVELWERYDAALEVVPTLHRFEERLDLLAEVVWPNERLLALQEAA